MAKRHDVVAPRAAGLRQDEVRKHTGVKERTNRRSVDEPMIGSPDDAAERARRGIGRPSKIEPWREKVLEMLEAEPLMQGLEVLRRLRLDGYGGKRALYELIGELRPTRSATRGDSPPKRRLS